MLREIRYKSYISEPTDLTVSCLVLILTNVFAENQVQLLRVQVLNSVSALQHKHLIPTAKHGGGGMVILGMFL